MGIGKTLQNTDYPVYLGVNLGRTLTFKEHCFKTIMKGTTYLENSPEVNGEHDLTLCV